MNLLLLVVSIFSFFFPMYVTKITQFFLGGDDGFLHVWDLRTFQQKTPLATFKHHTEPVTTVEWHPTDSAVFASGGGDNQIALWDLSVEKDAEAEGDEIDVSKCAL